ncbi:MAG TPA: hypothetical protein PK559_10385, partial [Ignavibacteriaceae bacterium]|nr:hypothetical protein [Ignavibacteriaceae bacterium]
YIFAHQQIGLSAGDFHKINPENDSLPKTSPALFSNHTFITRRLYFSFVEFCFVIEKCVSNFD